VVEQPAADTLLVQLVHPQQRGLRIARPGARMELVEGGSLITYGEAEVKRVEILNDEFIRLMFTRPLPNEVKPNDAVGLLRDYPAVHIHHCRMQGNRARGFLINSRGRTVVEDNYFHVPGSAILFEGDAHFWYEQGGVRDCVIRNNVFDNCNYGVWGKAVIEVKAGIEEQHRPGSRYNRNVVIEGNKFRVFDDGPIVFAYSIDGLTIRNNRIEKTDAYPPRELRSKRFDISHCDRVAIQDNGENP
jgi:nitrous oxidase accessory protein NosD